MDLSTTAARGALVTTALLATLAVAGCGKEQPSAEPDPASSATPTAPTTAPTSEPTTGPTTGPTATPTPTTTATRTPVVRTSVDTAALPTGPAPRIDVTTGLTLRTADGRTLELARRYLDLTTYDEGWLATYADDSGDLHGVLLDHEGRERGPAFRTTHRLGTDGTGRLVLYLQGRALALHDNASGSTRVLGTDVPAGTEPIGVRRGIAYYNVPGTDGLPDGRQLALDGDGGEQDPRAEGTFLYSAVHGAADVVAAMTRIEDDGSCSASVSDERGDLTRTCVHSAGEFSPDARHLIGLPAYQDGFGFGRLAVLDPATMRPVLTVQQSGDGEAAFVDVVWEDATHLLAVSHAEQGSGSRWQVLRVGLDGTVENAVAPLVTDDPESPFHF